MKWIQFDVHRPEWGLADGLCGSPSGDGNAPAGFPRISGQSPEYTIAQLTAYREGVRATDELYGAMMRQVAANLNDTEIFDSKHDVRVVLRTTNKILSDSYATSIEVEDARGRFTVDATTKPTMVALVPSEILIHKRDGSQLRARVSWGSMTAVGNQVRIVAENAKLSYVEPMRMAV